MYLDSDNTSTQWSWNAILFLSWYLQVIFLDSYLQKLSLGLQLRPWAYWGLPFLLKKASQSVNVGARLFQIFCVQIDLFVGYLIFFDYKLRPKFRVLPALHHVLIVTRSLSPLAWLRLSNIKDRTQSIGIRTHHWRNLFSICICIKPGSTLWILFKSS